VLQYLQAMDIYVLPSHTETTSLTTLEAMSVGLPVVVTRVGYIRHYVQHEKNGLFFERGNAEDLAKQLELLMGRPMLMQKLGRAGRETVVKEFSWQRTADGLLHAFEDVARPSSS